VWFTAHPRHTDRVVAGSHVGKKSIAHCPLHRGRPSVSHDWPVGHSTQYAPDAVHPGGHSWHVPCVEDVVQRYPVGPLMMSSHCRVQLGIVVTGYEQNSAPHVVEALQGPPLHTVSASGEHAWNVAHPTPHTLQGTHRPSALPPHPLLYCPAGHVAQFVHAPSALGEHGPRYWPEGHPPDAQFTQGGSTAVVPSHGDEWYIPGSHTRQATQDTTSDDPVPLHAPERYWPGSHRVRQEAQLTFCDAFGASAM
jgi:hypothetical protein